MSANKGHGTMNAELLAKAKSEPRMVFQSPRDVLSTGNIPDADRYVILWRWRAQAKKDGQLAHVKNIKRVLTELEQISNPAALFTRS